jgi:hypothetical protein
MAKIRNVVYDLLDDLKQQYDDKNLTPYRVLYWVSVFGNTLLKQHLDNEFKETGWRSGQYLTIFPEVKVLISPVSQGNIVKNRKYSKLPTGILDFHYESGISYIAYTPQDGIDLLPPMQSNKFQRTTAAIVDGLYVPFTEPSSLNPYFYIVGDSVYYPGLENTNVENVEMGIYSTIDLERITELDQEFNFPEHLLGQLKYSIFNLGNFILSIPQDKINDGNDTVVAHPPKQPQQNEQQ